MTDTRHIARQQQHHRIDERNRAVRALLMTPLMTSAHPEFALVRHHADELRAWFAREAGWPLHIERDCARLYKRPADLDDATRGLPGYERRHYVLLCLACATLERADVQITLRRLGEGILNLAAAPELAEQGFGFTLAGAHERRELVTVCRTLLALGVLQRIAGDEDSYVHDITGQRESADALYDIQRRVLAGMLAAVRGPSSWSPEQAPTTLPARLAALVQEHQPDHDEGQRTALRHHLARRLLDDPVVYLDALADDLRAYFSNQRGPLAARLCEATGLRAEQRAEGLALVDPDGALSDVAMPAEGTDAHATLLVAEFLARRGTDEGEGNDADASVAAPRSRAEVAAFLASAREHYGRYWRKAARAAGSEHELTRIALTRLAQLQLLTHDDECVTPLPALARFALGTAEVGRTRTPIQDSLFSDPPSP